MSSFRVLTLNILEDEHLRQQRLQMVIDGVRALKPDIVMLQEVDLEDGVDKQISSSLNGYYLSSCPRGGEHSHQGLSILSRQEPLKTDRLELSQNRVAQKLTLKIGSKKLNFINVHLYFSPIKDKPRQLQVQELMMFAAAPAIIAGDINAMPRSKSVSLLKSRFKSAYQKVHGSEPRRTYPTPLWRGKGIRHTARRHSINALGKLSGPDSQWNVTIDYIFIEKGIKVKDAKVVFDKPKNIGGVVTYASDHFGLMADIDIS